MAVDRVLVPDVFLSSNYVDSADWVAQNLTAMVWRNDGAGLGLELINQTDATIRGYATVNDFLTGGGVELTATGYTRRALTSVALSAAVANIQNFNVAEAQVTFGNPVASGQTLEGVLIYLGTTGTPDTSNVPVAYQEFPSGTATSDGPLNLQIPNMLIFDTLQVAMGTPVGR